MMVGNVALGSEHPIRIQTMTTTDTKDVAATVEQVFQLFHIILLPLLHFKEMCSVLTMYTDGVLLIRSKACVSKKLLYILIIFMLRTMVICSTFWEFMLVQLNL